MIPDFLTVDEVLIIHEDQINRFGGSFGLRDRALLELNKVSEEFEKRSLKEEFETLAISTMHLPYTHPMITRSALCRQVM